MLLRDCREILDDKWLTPNALVQRLVELAESPWSEWRHGKHITTRGVARLLKPFGIKSEQRREDGKKDRRYYRDAFEDAWARYLGEEIALSRGYLHRERDKRDTLEKYGERHDCIRDHGYLSSHLRVPKKSMQSG